MLVKSGPAAILSSLNSNFHSLLPAQSVPKRTPTHSDQFICTISGSMVLSKLFHQCGVAWAHLPFLECAPRDLPLAFDLFLTRVRLKAATENKHKQTKLHFLAMSNKYHVCANTITSPARRRPAPFCLLQLERAPFDFDNQYLNCRV
jgi:hypothetical protein